MNYFVYFLASMLFVVGFLLGLYMRRKFTVKIAELETELTDREQIMNLRKHNHKATLKIINHVAHNYDLETTLSEILPTIMEMTGSLCVAFYTVNNTKLSIKYSLGFGKNVYSEFDLTIGEGFVGVGALKREIMIIDNIPDDTVYIVRSFLGKIKPKSIMIVPVMCKDELVGVLAMANVASYSPENISFAENIRPYLGIAINNGVNAEKSKRMSNELAFQNKLIQSQHEEMLKNLRDKELLISHLIALSTDEVAYVLDADYKVLHWNITSSFPSERYLGKHIDQIYNELKLDPITPSLPTLIKTPTSSLFKDPATNATTTLYFSELSTKGHVGIIARFTKD
ncbi:MAG: GAF domain-containing protein [Turicibacter sp.]|nr:GAF domain-containing protein [Turicibacter sp.]